MDTERENSAENPKRKSGLRPPWTSETHPRKPGPGRPKGSGSKTLRDAMHAQLAAACGKDGKRTTAEAITAASMKAALKGDHKHLEIIRRITEGDRVEHTGAIEISYVADWRSEFTEADLAAASASGAGLGAPERAPLQLDRSGATLAQIHNGNGRAH